ncbi:ABC transporter ATP-binding protein [Elusimicrobiota bacterium]
MISKKVMEVKNLSKKFYIGTTDKLTLFSSLRYIISTEMPKEELWALENINFSVKKGTMTAIVGPNGAGKTTLLRVLSGIMKPTSGEYEVKEDVSTIFELGLGFNPMFTALQNVYLYGALHGLSRKNINEKLPKIIEFSELHKFMNTKLRDFSSGMRQRLAFATIIQTASGIIMIDEVLSVGDMSFKKKCFKAIEKLLSNNNTILFVSHGLGDARELCSKALYLNKGKQRGYGSVENMEELYEAHSEKEKSIHSDIREDN